MSYLETRRMPISKSTLVGVSLFQGLIILGIVRGLDIEFTAPLTIPVVQATNTPIPKPPPTAEPKVKPAPRDPDMQIDRPITTQPNPLATATANPQPLPSPTELASGPIVIVPQPPVTPSPTPSFAPRAVKPIGKPGTWATANDYPARDLREGNQGITRFQVTVGPDGRVQSCSVIASSGFPNLDAATCAKVSSRARFEPAIDSGGAKITSSYSNSIRWVIPE